MLVPCARHSAWKDHSCGLERFQVIMHMMFYISQDDIVNEVTAEHISIWPSSLAKYVTTNQMQLDEEMPVDVTIICEFIRFVLMV